MKHSLYFLILISSSLSAAEVGFNGIGYVTNIPNNSQSYYSVEIDSYNRIIVVGSVGINDNDSNGLIVRYNQDGTLDTTFNSVGYVTAENGTDSNSYYAVAIDSQDRIIVVGFTDAPDERGLIVRYLPSGALDEAFNSGGTPGYITINSQGIDECYGLTIDSLDRIIVVGQSTFGNTGFVRRYLSTGALESVFNIGGSQVTVFYDVTVDAQNRVIVVGQNNNFHATVVRFTSAGVLDTTFNTTGYKNTGNATLGQVYFSVAVDSLNRVITVGSNNFDDGVITRYKENGDFDTTFNTTGYSFTENSTDSARYSKVLIDSKNQPLVVGETDNPSHGLIARYNQDGLLDTTFNAPHGFINTANNPNSSSYESVVIDNNNKILVVGRTDDDNGLLARYLLNGVLDAESNWNLKNFRESKNMSNVSIGLLG